MGSDCFTNFALLVVLIGLDWITKEWSLKEYIPFIITPLSLYVHDRPELIESASMAWDVISLGNFDVLLARPPV